MIRADRNVTRSQNVGANATKDATSATSRLRMPSDATIRAAARITSSTRRRRVLGGAGRGFDKQLVEEVGRDDQIHHDHQQQQRRVASGILGDANLAVAVTGKTKRQTEDPATPVRRRRSEGDISRRDGQDLERS